MAKGNNKSINIKRYKAKKGFNIGIFLFAVVLIYLVVTITAYLLDDKPSIYEVREGSIVKDNTYTGLIIRQETTVNADESGYINYYQNENSKIKYGAALYAISQEKLNLDEASSETSSTADLNSDVQSGIVNQVQTFNESYNSSDFSSIYSLKSDIQNALQNAYSTTKTAQLASVIENSGQEVTIASAEQDGIISYSIDGLESLTVDSFTAKDFDKTDYKATELTDQMKISSGSPAYRLITSENWSVVIPLKEKTAKEFQEADLQNVQVRIDKDSEKMWAGFSVLERDGNYYGVLNFDNSMIRYASERFLNVELILEDESGLKIPKTSVVEEQFFVIPKDYITNGGNSSSEGVMVLDSKGNVSFQAVEIYDTSDDGEIYLSRDQIKSGTVIVKPDSSDTYTIENTKPLKGVYNINKGYAIFKKVSILCENDEYYIVQEGDSYGLSNYDHIIQNGTGVSSDDVVFQ